MVFVEEGAIDKIPYILFIAFREEHKGFRVPFWCAQQALTFGILADAFEYYLDSSCDFIQPFLSLLRSGLAPFTRSDTWI